MNIPLESLILTVEYDSSTSIKLAIRAANSSTPVLTDIRRTSIYGLETIEVQTNNNVTISGRFSLDDIVYSQSEETLWMHIRMQNPTTNLWSMCEMHTFASQGRIGTSVIVEWLYTGVTFQTP